MNDEQFYAAFRSDARQPGIEINPGLFENIIKKDRAKMKFIQRFTNLFTGEKEERTDTTGAMNTEPKETAPLPVSSCKCSCHVSATCSAKASEEKQIYILYSDMDESCQDMIVDYLLRYWNPEVCFASAYLILLKLERERGPGWRLDKIFRRDTVREDAVPNSTFNFCFRSEHSMYSIWRQEAEELPGILSV
ncbi:unnamed protein product [Dicrocoelium dendriticum]|nr:unnamed protein product [Dicrocoelium dendriticum]